MMMLFRLLLILSLSAVAPLNPNVNKEATEEDLVTDDISGVNGDGVVSDGIDNHTFENTNRDAKHIFYGGNIKFSGTIDSTGNHAHINIGSISNNAAVQDHHHEPDSSQEVKPEPKPIDLDNSSPCSFNGALLSAPVLVKGEMSPHDTRLSFLWEKKIIPYYYSDQNTKVADKNLIRSVMNTIESETCFEFQEETKEDYEDEHSLEINIKPELCSGGVIGSVDTVPGHLRLLLTLTAQVTDQYGKDCGNEGLILHELMHVLGVGHTQRRSDRDDFITVKWENLDADEKFKDQYRKCENCTLYDGIPYDCDSIMHYGTHYNGKVVIEAKNKDTCKLGSKSYVSKEASSTDWKLLNIIGNCTVCTADQFSCLSGQQCINMDFKCDGEKECADGSDEVNCENTGYEKLWRDDGRCGTDYPLDNGEKGQCDPTYGKAPCCSRWGYCGNSPDHCECTKCVNYAVCAADQFTCSSGGCIEQEKRCDGVPDCGDKSDESKCIVSGEGVDIEFRAEEGEDHPSKRMGVYLKTDQEIRGRPVYKQKEQKLDEQQFLFFGLDEHWRVGPNKEKADGIGLKNEWKDEKMINETTPPKNGWLFWDVQKGEWISDTSIQIREVCADYQFSCLSGECIYPEMRCDGDKDCLDGSDEEIGDCQSTACTGNQFFCSGKCIKENEKCDGFWDCANGEDETNCQEQGSGKLWRDDLRCGEEYPLENGKPAQCDPIHRSPCCSSWGYCGNTDDHCECPTCKNYKVTCRYKDDLSSVLLENNWRTQNQIDVMSYEDQRSTVIVEVEQMTGHTITDLQGRDNVRDLGSLISIANMATLLIKYSIKSSSEVKTMTYEPHLRNTLIVEASQRFSIQASELQGMTDPQLLKTFCTGSKPKDEDDSFQEEEEEDDLGCSFNDDILADKVLPSGQMSPHSGKERFQWKNNKINYYFQPQPRPSDKKLVQEVMERIKEKTCFEFVERRDSLQTWDSKHCLEIKIKDKGCTGVSGSVDKKSYGDGLVLKLTGQVTKQNGEDCGYKGLILHELMHVLGVGHTHRRSDRDYSITVYQDNIDKEDLTFQNQFKVCGKCTLYPGIDYDCDSIMHYGTHFNQKKMMEPKYENCTLSPQSKMYLKSYQDGTNKDWELLNIIGKVRCP